MSGPPPRGRALRIGRAVARIAALVVVATIGIELSLQTIALFAVDRSTPWRPGAAHRILCVGDSHTYGAGVRAEQAYPAQLQRMLDEATPGAYTVVNRGVPGFNTAQVRRRLPEWIDALAPTTVVVIAGANNTWNLTDVADVEGWRARLAALAGRLRIVRFVQSWRAHRRLDAAHDVGGIPFGDRPKYQLGLGTDAVVDWGSEQEHVQLERRTLQVDDAAIDRARRDYQAIASLARARGVALVFLGYPAPNPIFDPFTAAMRLVAGLNRDPFVDAAAAVRRVPQKRMTWTYGLHAGPAGLGEIARDVAAAIVATDAHVPGDQAPNSTRPPRS
jgi:GDSL-like Lipase/Acylhydrolase family